MPAKKKRTHGPKKFRYGVEDSSGNVLISPYLTSVSEIFKAATALADSRGESVYLFEVEKPSGPHINRQEVSSLKPHKKYGVEDSSGNVLISPHVASMGEIFRAASKLADSRDESVYLFEVRKPSDTHTNRQEVRPLKSRSTPHKKTDAELRQEIAEAMTTPWTEPKKTDAELRREIVAAMTTPWIDKD